MKCCQNDAVHVLLCFAFTATKLVDFEGQTMTLEQLHGRFVAAGKQLSMQPLYERAFIKPGQNQVLGLQNMSQCY
jgi:hypothetical protein